MISLRVMASAFLSNGNDVLLLKRSDRKSFYPGVWSGVGGHVNPGELNDPQSACLREILEETGIEETCITDLTLRYIVLRRKVNEIRVTYVYFGTVDTRDVTGCDEGELYWIARDDLLDRPMSAMNELVLRRFIEWGEEPEIMAGTLNLVAGKPSVEWMPVASWDGL